MCILFRFSMTQQSLTFLRWLQLLLLLLIQVNIFHAVDFEFQKMLILAAEHFLMSPTILTLIEEFTRSLNLNNNIINRALNRVVEIGFKLAHLEDQSAPNIKINTRKLSAFILPLDIGSGERTCVLPISNLLKSKPLSKI